MSRFRFIHRQAKGQECPYCIVKTEIVSGDVIYPSRPDLHDRFYSMCPSCKAFVGCHKGTKFPLGMVAGTDLRQLRMLAHKYFDSMWRRKTIDGVTGGKKSRVAAYKWLRSEFSIPKDYCHIAMFDEEACLVVIDLCKPYFIEKPAEHF